MLRTVTHPFPRLLAAAGLMLCLTVIMTAQPAGAANTLCVGGTSETAIGGNHTNSFTQLQSTDGFHFIPQVEWIYSTASGFDPSQTGGARAYGSGPNNIYDEVDFVRVAPLNYAGYIWGTWTC